MPQPSQNPDLEHTAALVEQARAEARLRMAQVDKEESVGLPGSTGAAVSGVDEAGAASRVGVGLPEDEDADPVGGPAER